MNFSAHKIYISHEFSTFNLVPHKFIYNRGTARGTKLVPVVYDMVYNMLINSSNENIGNFVGIL